MPRQNDAPAAPPGIDHLVVVAHTLAEGVAWCELTLGVTPGPGGEHPLMGTHNRLLSVASPPFPAAYLEIIAINPVADSSTRISGKRWFDMDSEPLRQRVQRDGPQLVHWVARVPDLTAALVPLAAAGLHPGEPVAASRQTAHGLLTWHITLRPDGQRQLGGCLPTLIQWGTHHPTDTLPPSGVSLQALRLGHPQAPLLAQALSGLGMAAQVQAASQPLLHAVLATPKAAVTLTMPTLG
jgi:hypothetical protein